MIPQHPRVPWDPGEYHRPKLLNRRGQVNPDLDLFQRHCKAFHLKKHFHQCKKGKNAQSVNFHSKAFLFQHTVQWDILHLFGRRLDICAQPQFRPAPEQELSSLINAKAEKYQLGKNESAIQLHLFKAGI